MIKCILFYYLIYFFLLYITMKHLKLYEDYNELDPFDEEDWDEIENINNYVITSEFYISLDKIRKTIKGTLSINNRTTSANDRLYWHKDGISLSVSNNTLIFYDMSSNWGSIFKRLSYALFKKNYIDRFTVTFDSEKLLHNFLLSCNLI